MGGVRYVPMNGIIVNHQIGVIPTMERVGTYKPYQMTCPYCTTTGMTVPEISWNCGACCFFTICDIYFLGLASLIRCCLGGDCCCYDAIHKCPNCGRIIAKRDTCHR